MRGSSSMHGPTGGNSGPGPQQLTIDGVPLQPVHWWYLA
jgi:hypothetical protein